MYPGRSGLEFAHCAADEPGCKQFNPGKEEGSNAHESNSPRKHGSQKADFHSNDPNRPVEQVSWNDVQEFINILNQQQTGLNARLPSEAEWEYACRAGKKTAFSFGGKADLNTEKVNYSGKWDEWNSAGETRPVKTYLPNDWGLYEMHGNVWEWCRDAWQEKLPATPVTDPRAEPGKEQASARVVRGGSWSSYGRDCRSAIRYWYAPGFRIYGLGFRLSLGPGAKDR